MYPAPPNPRWQQPQHPLSPTSPSGPPAGGWYHHGVDPMAQRHPMMQQMQRGPQQPYDPNAAHMYQQQMSQQQAPPAHTTHSPYDMQQPYPQAQGGYSMPQPAMHYPYPQQGGQGYQQVHHHQHHQQQQRVHHQQPQPQQPQGPYQQMHHHQQQPQQAANHPYQHPTQAMQPQTPPQQPTQPVGPPQKAQPQASSNSGQQCDGKDGLAAHAHAPEWYPPSKQPKPSSLDAGAPSFVPKGKPERAVSPTAAAAPAAAVPSKGKYVPPSSPRSRVGYSVTPEQEALLYKPLLGVIRQYHPETESGFIDSAEAKAAFGRDITFMVDKCKSFVPKDGETVVFYLSQRKFAYAGKVLLEHDEEVSTERYFGHIKTWNDQTGEGMIESPAAAKWHAGRPIKIGRSGDAALQQGLRVTFRIRFEQEWLAAVDVIALPVSLEQLDAFCSPDHTAPEVQAAAPGQNPWEIDVVFFHASCWDGLCSAYAFYNAAGARRGEIEFYPVQTSMVIDDTTPNVKGKNIAVVDVIFNSSEFMKQLVEESSSVVVIDHHLSSEEPLKFLAKDKVCFDLEYPACALAWEFCRKAVELNAPPEIKKSISHGDLPKFLSLVGEVDLGKFGLDHPIARRWAIGVELFSRHKSFQNYPEEGTVPINLGQLRKPSDCILALEALASLDKYIKGSDEVVRKVLRIGEDTEVALEERINTWMGQLKVMKFRQKPEVQVAIVDLSTHNAGGSTQSGVAIPWKFARNELGHRLSRLPGVSCGAVIAGKAVMLRCDHDRGFNVASIAGLHGGGGHATAAAFQLEDAMEWPFIAIDDDDDSKAK